LYMACDDAQVIKLRGGSAPLLSGYIRGNYQICTNEPQEYTINILPGTQVQWRLPENSLNEVYGNKVVIEFSKPGVYELSANLINSCGTSSARMITIEVGTGNLLTIDGKQKVKEEEAGLNYMLNGNIKSRFLWNVEGGNVDLNEGNSVEVSWGIAGNGQVEVFEINTRNQCRSYASLDVNIEGHIGVKEDWEEQFTVYPNPVRSVLSIKLPLELEQNSSLQLSSLSGNILWHKKLDGMANMISLNVDDLPSGIYLIEVRSSTGISVVKKIVVRE